MKINWKKFQKNLKSKIHYLNCQFTIVEWLVIFILAILLSIGLYKGIIWMIQQSMMGSTFYQVMRTD